VTTTSFAVPGGKNSSYAVATPFDNQWDFDPIPNADTLIVPTYF